MRQCGCTAWLLLGLVVLCSATQEVNRRGSAGTKVNSKALPNEECVICEYTMEVIDRMLKAQPRLMNGNGYYPGVMDFGGGIQQGNYRVYQGTYLETGEEAAQHLRHTSLLPAGSGKGDTPAGKGPKPQIPAWVGRSQRQGGRLQQHTPTEDSSEGAGATLDSARDVRFSTVAADTDKSETAEANSSPAQEPPKLPPIKHRHTFRDYDRTDDQKEKDSEFATMYKDFMDGLDDVCYRDMPAQFVSHCRALYENGAKIVEMYLHDYDDWEICQQILPSCAQFFEDTEVSR